MTPPKNLYLLFFCVIGICVDAFSQNSASVTTAAPEIQTTVKNQFSLNVDLSTSTNGRPSDDADANRSSTLILTPVVQLAPNYSVNSAIRYDRDHINTNEQSMANTVLKINRTAAAVELLNSKIGGDIRGVLPTNSTERREHTLTGALGTGINVSTEINILSRPLSVFYEFNGVKNFHELETKSDFSPNLSHRFRHVLSFAQPLTDAVSVDVEGFYQFGYTYDGSLRTHYMHQESVNFQVSKAIKVSLFMAIDDAALGPDGESSNAKLFSQYKTTFGTGLNATF
jgi:hypothetical protein